MYLVYILIVIMATFGGSMTGMGGGVIIKPALDALCDYSASVINILSTCCVFSMSAFSSVRRIIRQKRQAELKLKDAETSEMTSAPRALSIPSLVGIGVGSVAGGYLGQLLFDIARGGLPESFPLKKLQNIILAVLIAVIFVYIQIRDRRGGATGVFRFGSPISMALIGVSLGIVSAFLGIGGGPINVAVLMLFCSLGIKDAAFVSLVSIFFTQTSKLITIALTSGYEGVSPILAALLSLAAIGGAYIGTTLSAKISSKTVSVLFNVMQAIILCICIVNIAV